MNGAQDQTLPGGRCITVPDGHDKKNLMTQSGQGPGHAETGRSEAAADAGGEFPPEHENLHGVVVPSGLKACLKSGENGLLQSRRHGATLKISTPRGGLK